MPEIFRLKLPREIEPVFPDCCIVCGRPEPDHRATLFTAAVRRGPFKGYQFEVPCCLKCAVGLHAKRLASGLLPILILFGGTILVSWVAGFIGVFAFVGWRIAFPPAFTVERDDKFIAFEFRTFTVAQEFRRLNPQSVATGSLTSA